MKNKKYILLALLILTCGVLFMNYKIKENEKIEIEYLDSLADKQEPYIKKYLTYYFNGIETVTLTTKERIPTGTVGVHGYINNDPSLGFTATFDSDKPGSNMGLLPTFDITPMRKPESETPAKNMEEILKEERKKKRAEEKTSSTQNWFNI